LAVPGIASNRYIWVGLSFFHVHLPAGRDAPQFNGEAAPLDVATRFYEFAVRLALGVEDPEISVGE
jgi:hypothetical protein